MKRLNCIALGTLLTLSIAGSACAVEKRKTTPETIREDLIVAHCKAEAKKYFSVLHPRKRRTFRKNCIERANR
jgi:hypothetical protein